MVSIGVEMAKTIEPAPAGVCAACEEKRVHTVAEWKLHRFAGHGYSEGIGWSHPDLKKVSGSERPKGVSDNASL
jgi:hypothetical protein